MQDDRSLWWQHDRINLNPCFWIEFARFCTQAGLHRDFLRAKEFADFRFCTTVSNDVELMLHRIFDGCKVRSSRHIDREPAVDKPSSTEGWIYRLSICERCCGKK